MNRKLYVVRFKAGKVQVRAFNQKEAEILAQAEAIQNGWDYTILEIIYMGW